MFKLKKLSIASFLIMLSISCQDDRILKPIVYGAKDLNNNQASLELYIHNQSFYGNLDIKYSNNMSDSGTIKGEIIGDTLKGRFSHIAFSGAKKVSPFILLKQGDTLKMGAGQTATYMQIPFFLPETIIFENSNFQFLPK